VTVSGNFFEGKRSMKTLAELTDFINNNDVTHVLMCNPIDKNAKDLPKKAVIRPVAHKNEVVYQLEEFIGTQAFHRNLNLSEVAQTVEKYMSGFFKEATVASSGSTISVLTNKKGTVTIKEKKNEVQSSTEFKPMLPNMSHNRTKNYLLKEGVPTPFLYELGVMTKEGQVVKAKYDKFKQLNRFLEFVDDIVPALPKNREITIIDFGCGKSYLTFAVYHYLVVMKQMDVRIIGLDLKEKVISDCNALAKKLGYEKLSFLCGDIKDYAETDHVDMVMTLHACDIATDLAIHKAVKWGASVILSVPCCQHELNKTIANDTLSPVFEYGLIKERTAALFTDGLRAGLLECIGYNTQILEFIDMEHTPKNILIRAVKNQKKSGTNQEKLAQLKNCMNALNVSGTLFELLKKDELI